MEKPLSYANNTGRKTISKLLPPIKALQMSAHSRQEAGERILLLRPNEDGIHRFG